MKYEITITDDNLLSPLKGDSRTPITIIRRSAVDFEVVDGWISVKDAMPDVAIGGLAKVLVTDGRAVIPAEFYVKRIDGWTGDWAYAWRSGDVSSELLCATVTHWQPLPSPPKESIQGAQKG